MLSPEGYIQLRKERFEADNPASVYNINTNLAPYELEAYNKGLTVDWFDEVTRVAPFKNSTLSVSGATSRFNYYVSGNYMNQKGIVVGDQFHKFPFWENSRPGLPIGCVRVSIWVLQVRMPMAPLLILTREQS